MQEFFGDIRLQRDSNDPFDSNTKPKMSDSFDFKLLAPAYSHLKESGIALQQKGMELVKIADSGIANIAPMETFALTCLELCRNHPEVAPVVQSLFDSGKRTLAVLEKTNTTMADAMPHINISVATATFAASGSNVAVGTAVETLLGIVPEQRDVIFHAWPARGLARSFTEEDLDAFLTKFDNSLPERRRGAWHAYYSASDDAVAQASHSMRVILEKIISKEAANNKIEACSWYKARKVREPNTKPSIKDRVRFLLFGPSEEGIDKAELDTIEKAVHVYVNDDCTLKSIAHGSRRFSREEIKLSMENIEELLFLILKRLC